MSDQVLQQPKTNTVWEFAKRHKGKLAATVVLSSLTLWYVTAPCGDGCPPNRMRIPGTSLCWIPC